MPMIFDAASRCWRDVPRAVVEGWRAWRLGHPGWTAPVVRAAAAAACASAGAAAALATAMLPAAAGPEARASPKQGPAPVSLLAFGAGQPIAGDPRPIGVDALAGRALLPHGFTPPSRILTLIAANDDAGPVRRPLPIPEPGTLSLLAGALGALAACCSIRKWFPRRREALLREYFRRNWRELP